MAKVFMTLQGKGGVGKSLVSALVAQHFIERGITPRCFDTDPVNRTFGSYQAFNTTKFQLGHRVDQIDPRSFDGLIEEILSAEPEEVFVIDNGASTFLPLINYLAESEAVSILTESGHSVIPISILTGGQALKDTAMGLSQLAQLVPAVELLIVLNEYFGPIQSVVKGKTVQFTETRLYSELEERVRSVIVLPEINPATFGKDLDFILSRHLTFSEAAADEGLSIIAKHRLKSLWGRINEALSEANL
ncbi:hypothetical protein [Nisaea denitrificans]|uniref:hypothetical protein n=1 Tax=Nisaea denitrificans TaxID=390877 RepID=UPI0004220C32|nr:hypothetical protein [Nisaea denitrificans]|tara:strand:- start:1469 stop:2209 length:741 start_codon:yes stop_codon:yes gene_type:complete